MVKNDVITHAEDPANPWYTPEGDACGRNANIMVSSSATASDAYAIDVWMQAPFHAVGMLDPRLLRVGYGAYREADGGWQMGAALDVLRGWEGIPEGIAFPIRWPGEGTTTFLRAFEVGEYPDPLAHCGYSAPAGLPILMLFGTGSFTPSITAHQLLRDGTPVAHCVFDETTYTHPDSAQRSLGRAILNSRDAVVILPRDPLGPGSALHRLDHGQRPELHLVVLRRRRCLGDRHHARGAGSLKIPCGIRKEGIRWTSGEGHGSPAREDWEPLVG